MSSAVSVTSTPPSRIAAAVPIKDQGEADAVVDALRAGGVSVVSMSRRRKTLEDAFLEVVAQTAEIV